jgi:putative tricarboxylic transport membrane protein
MRKTLAVGLWAWAAASSAQGYPVKPIELMVHTSAGSGGDVVSRTVAEIVRRHQFLPQPLLVNQRVGGAGVVGFNYFKSHHGDPYLMASINGTILALAYRPDIAIGLDNNTPLALYAIDPQTVMVPANSPYKTFKDLMEAAKAHPDTLVDAVNSIQGTGRLVVYLMEKQVPGTKFKFVTFKGGGEAVTSVAGGHVTFTTENLSEGISFVQSGQLRVLAISASQRLPQAPDIPTLTELGYPIEAGTFRGYAFPAGVPKQAVSVMENVLKRVHDTPEWKEAARRNLYQDVYMGQAEFTRFLNEKLAETRDFYDAVGLGRKQ